MLLLLLPVTTSQCAAPNDAILPAKIGGDSFIEQSCKHWQKKVWWLSINCAVLKAKKSQHKQQATNKKWPKQNPKPK